MMESGRRVALITGGAGALGSASARCLADRGHRVVVTDLSADAAREVAATCAGQGHSGYAMDVALERSICDVFRSVERDIGPISVLVTFAGVLIMDPNRRPGFAETSVDEWETTMAVNGRGTFLCIREMIRARQALPVEHGRIITISSIAAQIGSAYSSIPYAASKGAVISLTKSAAREAAKIGMTVNSIAPGTFESDIMRKAVPANMQDAVIRQIPLGRLGIHEEIAETVGFLASRGAGYITGTVIDVNGGFRI